MLRVDLGLTNDLKEQIPLATRQTRSRFFRSIFEAEDEEEEEKEEEEEWQKTPTSLFKHLSETSPHTK